MAPLTKLPVRVGRPGAGTCVVSGMPSGSAMRCHALCSRSPQMPPSLSAKMPVTAAASGNPAAASETAALGMLSVS